MWDQTSASARAMPRAARAQILFATLRARMELLAAPGTGASANQELPGPDAKRGKHIFTAYFLQLFMIPIGPASRNKWQKVFGCTKTSL